jgi:hypothetical protein
VPVGAAAVTTITGTETNILAVASASGITKAGSWAVTVDSGTLTAAHEATIDTANGAGVITATISDTSAAILASTLTGTGNALTTTIAAGSAAASDLIAIDAKTTVAVGAANVTTVTGTATEVAAFAAAETAGTITAAANYSATVSGANMTVSQANAIDAANGTGIITATIADATASTLLGLTGSSNNYNLTITDSVSIESLTAIDAKTTGTVTYPSITDTAANLATLSGPTYISGKNVFIKGTINDAEFNAIDTANGLGRVTLLDLRLSAPNSNPTVTSSTSLVIIPNNKVAKTSDAAGDQTFEIEAGGKLVLENVQGHNVIKFDEYSASELSVTYLGTTAIFTASLDPNKPQIASIAMTNQGPSQTITYSNGSHVELTLTGTTLALDGVIILNTGTIL